MSEAKMCINPCETCEKNGLPILLTRYAIHAVESRSAALMGWDFGESQVNKISLGENTKYGLRLLRSGYVYVYDEARKYRDEYFVTVDGFLTKMPPRPKVGSRAVPATEFSCARSGAAPLASVITIRNPKHASNVWIGFSDVEWTKETWKRHEDAAYRKRHMQKIVIIDGKVAAQPHTAPIERVDALVPEYKLNSEISDKYIKPWAPFQFNDRVLQVKDLKAAVQKERPQGGAAIVALHDPASIAAELDALMNYRLKRFMGDAKRQHPLATSQAIEQLENAIRTQAVDREESFGEERATKISEFDDSGEMFESYRAAKSELIKDMRTVTPAEMKRVADKAWKPYAEKIDESAMKVWRSEYEKELGKFDAEHISPLAKAHRDWMKCDATSEYFACNFDEADVDNGLAYVLTLSQCMGSTQDKAACFDLYTEWLSASTFEKTNLLLNAFALNQEIAKEKLQKAAEVSLDWRGFSWDALAGSLGETYKGNWAKMAEAIGSHLVTRAMGPLAKIADQSAAAGRAKLSLVSMSVFSGKPYTVIDVVGSKKRFREMLVKQLIKLSGQPLNENKIRRAVAAEIRRMEISGTKLDGRESKRFLIFLDESHLKGMPSKLSAADKVKYAVEKLSTVEKIEMLEMGHWRTKLGQPRAAMVNGSYPYLVGLIGAIFQYQAMAKLGEDEQKSMSHEITESRYRLGAGITAFWGTVADLTGKGLEKTALFIPKVAKGLAPVVGRIFSYIGSRAGIIGAGVVAYWDGKAGLKYLGERKYGMAVLCGASAFLGISSAFLLLFSTSVAWAGTIALIMISLLIAMAVLIEYLKDNKIQEWLKRCYWKNNSYEMDKYPDIEIEMKQLSLAAG
ncbi:MAG: hypothetical protein LBE51_02070 [Acidovorax sp.]|jgi:hypothetical protein|nr:hypothetical protein [Acidovorax sp.]